MATPNKKKSGGGNNKTASQTATVTGIMETTVASTTAESRLKKSMPLHIQMVLL